MGVDEGKLATFEASLSRCNADPAFLDRFYDRFLASSPKVKEKFARTDFPAQKSALRASLGAMLLAARNGGSADKLLGFLADRHSRRQLNIGAEFYDLWLDSLLATVEECDPEYDTAIQAAWEDVMAVGIRYLLCRY